MADSPTMPSWTVPARGDGNGDVQFSNTLPGGRNMPYGSLGAQLLDSMMISRLLPGAPGGGYTNNRYNFSNFSPNWPGGGFPLPGQTGTGVGMGGGFNPGGSGGGGLGGTPPGGGLLNPGSNPLPPQITHGNDPAGTGNNQWGPYAQPAAGVGNWQAIVNKLYGQGDPILALQKAMGTNTYTFGGKTISDTNVGKMADIRRSLAAAGLDTYTAAKIAEAFGGSGAGAESAANILGIGSQYQQGGQYGFRAPQTINGVVQGIQNSAGMGYGYGWGPNGLLGVK